MIKVNGTTIPAPDTYEVTIADLDASANRSGNGTLFRDRVAVKRTIDMSWTSLSASELSVLLKSVSSIFFTVNYLDPVDNASKTGTFYVSDRKQGVAIKNRDGSYTWKGISFSFIER